VAEAQDEFRAELSDWPADELERYVSRLSPAYWLKVELPRRVAHARFVRAAQREDRSPAVDVGFDTARGVTELTVLAPDHPWLLSYLAGACAASGANIVNAQIYTTTDGMALDTIAISREFERDEDEKRRADRVAGAIEEASRLDLRLPDAAVKRRLPKGRFGAFAVEPEVIINNQWSNNYTVIEISGLDRPGLLYDLTAALSDLNLNIASAHVATFGERAVDVFYVTDLHGAKIVAPNRNAAIKRALLDQFAPAAQTA
jgi:[protein-PII] uridylyltransferase